MAENTVAPVSERFPGSFIEKSGWTHQCKCVRDHHHVHVCICGKTWGVAR